MAIILDKVKGKKLNIKSEEVKWFRLLLENVLKGSLLIDNVRASYKSKSDWVKVSFWCKVKRIDKEEKKDAVSTTGNETTEKTRRIKKDKEKTNGSIKTNESNG